MLYVCPAFASRQKTIYLAFAVHIQFVPTLRRHQSGDGLTLRAA